MKAFEQENDVIKTCLRNPSDVREDWTRRGDFGIVTAARGALAGIQTDVRTDDVGQGDDVRAMEYGG